MGSINEVRSPDVKATPDFGLCRNCAPGIRQIRLSANMVICQIRSRPPGEMGGGDGGRDRALWDRAPKFNTISNTRTSQLRYL